MKRLILFEFHLLGDAVMSLPFLNAAQKKYDVYACCSDAAAKMYELVLPADHVIRLELSLLTGGERKPGQWKRFWEVRRQLKRIDASVAVGVWADVRVHLLAFLLGIPERIGFEMNLINYYAHHIPWRMRNLRMGRLIQKASKFFGKDPLTKALERNDYQQHHMLDWSQLAAALELPLDLENPWIDAAKIRPPSAAEPFFQQHRGEPIWLLHPGAAKECKRWPHFDALARQVFLKGNIPLVILDDPNVPKIDLAYDNCLHWPMSSLADFIALTARCDFVLCNDSAASHLAAALGKRVVTIFSSGSASWFAPFTPKRIVFESFICPYRPCLDRCLQPSFICRDDTSLEAVGDRIEALIHEPEARAQLPS